MAKQMVYANISQAAENIGHYASFPQLLEPVSRHLGASSCHRIGMPEAKLQPNYAETFRFMLTTFVRLFRLSKHSQAQVRF